MSLPAFLQVSPLPLRSVLLGRSNIKPLCPRLRVQQRAPNLPTMTLSERAPPKISHKTQQKLDRVVCKFGGSSLANSDCLKEATKLVKLQINKSNKMPIVVLSAMGTSTDELLTAGNRALEQGIVDTSTIRSRAYQVCDDLGLNKEVLVEPLLRNIDELLVGVKFIKELSPRTSDYLVSFGERLSVRIFAAHLKQNEGIPAEAIDAFDAGFVTNSKFTKAELLDETYGNVKSYFKKHLKDDQLAVVTGYIAKDSHGHITTLGRGGSDLTASVLGSAIGATEVQVWKDVDGILSTDPRIVKEAAPIPSISFEEAAEMAFFGAKILHPTAMQPAMKANIPVRVKNSYNPDHPGTVIVKSREFDSDNPVTAISLKKNVRIVDVVSTHMLGAYGFLAEVFKAFASHQISVDMISTSEVSISMTLDNKICDETELLELKKDLESFSRVTLSDRNKAIISLVSDSSRSTIVVRRALSALDRAGVKALMISQGACKFNVSITIEGDQASEAVQAVHKEFFH